MIAAVLTANLRLPAAPGNVAVTTEDTGLSKDSVVNVSQIITVDKAFLTDVDGGGWYSDGARSINDEQSPGIAFRLVSRQRGYEASLEVGKLYRVIPDAEAAAHGYIRVVDESDEITPSRRVAFIRWSCRKPWRGPCWRHPGIIARSSTAIFDGTSNGSPVARRILRLQRPIDKDTFAARSKPVNCCRIIGKHRYNAR